LVPLVVIEAAPADDAEEITVCPERPSKGDRRNWPKAQCGYGISRENCLQRPAMETRLNIDRGSADTPSR
jgi:hypothetical protein